MADISILDTCTFCRRSNSNTVINKALMTGIRYRNIIQPLNGAFQAVMRRGSESTQEAITIGNK